MKKILKLHKNMVGDNPLRYLNLAGGNFDGIDGAIHPLVLPTVLSISGTIIYRHKRDALISNFPLLLKIQATDGKGVTMYLDELSSMMHIKVQAGTYFAQTNTPLTIGVDYVMKFDFLCTTGNPTGLFTLNGSGANIIGMPQPSADIGSMNIIGPSYGAGTGKISVVDVVYDGVQFPNFRPSIDGVFGTADAGNGWVLSDASPNNWWT